MRMLVCTPWYVPARAFGGTVTVAVATVTGGVEAGHEVTVATTDAHDLQSRVPADAPAEPPGTSRGQPGLRAITPRGVGPMRGLVRTASAVALAAQGHRRIEFLADDVERAGHAGLAASA